MNRKCCRSWKSSQQLLRRYYIANKKNLTDILTTAFKKDAKENFPEAPDCCFELMFRRFSKIRLHFEGDFIDRKLQSGQKDEIKNAEFGSKSSKAVKL